MLKEYEAGKKAKDVCREHGISEATFYNWKKKRTLEGGASAYLTKPIGANQLIEVLEKFC